MTLPALRAAVLAHCAAPADNGPGTVYLSPTTIGFVDQLDETELIRLLPEPAQSREWARLERAS